MAGRWTKANTVGPFSPSNFSPPPSSSSTSHFRPFDGQRRKPRCRSGHQPHQSPDGLWAAVAIVSARGRAGGTAGISPARQFSEVIDRRRLDGVWLRAPSPVVSAAMSYFDRIISTRIALNCRRRPSDCCISHDKISDYLFSLFSNYRCTREFMWLERLLYATCR